MNRDNKTLLKRLMVYAGMFLLSVTIQGKNNHAEAAESVINVLDYGACGSDAESDRKALNEALRAAGRVSDGQETEVYVPPGTYYLEDFIGIYSNTWLHLADGARIVRMDGCYTNVMLTGLHDNANGGICYWDCNHHGYGQVQNVRISGGEWDGNLQEGEFAYPDGKDLSQCMMSLQHARDITICDTRIGNSDGKHFVNLDGIDGITIRDCVFHDQWRNEAFPYSVEDWNGAEVIHTDYICPDGWSKAFPVDEDLACKDVLVENCTFDNCISGIGTHNFKMGLYMEGFTVRDCSFSQMQGHCINALGCIDAVITGNTASDVSQFVQMHRNQNGLVAENNVSCRAYYKEETAIDLCHGTECTVQNNSIRTAATHAVYCANLDDDSSGDCSVTITQNEIDAPGSSGIFVRDGVNATVKGNSITESGSGADAGISVFLNQQEVSISGNELEGFSYGIKVSKCCGRTYVESNSISDASKHGMSVYQSSSVLLSGGEISGSKIGVCADGSSVKESNLALETNGKDMDSINGGSIVGTDKALEDNAQAESPGKNEASSNGKKPQGAGSRIADTKSAIPVYRVFNPRTGEHFYTESEYERNILVQRGWNGEGIGWYAPQKSSTPVYRLYNPNSGEHHYTCSRIEKNWLVILGWRYEGIGWYSDDNKEVAIYRHYHPIQRTGNHHFTMSKGESRHIVNYEGWRYEGIGWYGVLTD